MTTAALGTRFGLRMTATRSAEKVACRPAKGVRYCELWGVYGSYSYAVYSPDVGFTSWPSAMTAVIGVVGSTPLLWQHGGCRQIYPRMRVRFVDTLINGDALGIVKATERNGHQARSKSWKPVNRRSA